VSSGRPVAVAITGGIGAGKSEALAAFARHGAATLSADEVVHDLIEHDEDVRAALRDRFGTTDRAQIGAVVFADGGELAWLEALLHPRVREREDAWLAAVDAPLAAIEIPLLYETGGERRFDKVVVVTAPAGVRRARSHAAGGSREARLIPDPEKAARADYVYENAGSLDDLEQFVVAVVADLT
jgi:dephospho-CoA kinase